MPYQGRVRILERGSILLGLRAKGGQGLGFSFGLNVKKPTSWAKRGARTPEPPPPRLDPILHIKAFYNYCLWYRIFFLLKAQNIRMFCLSHVGDTGYTRVCDNLNVNFRKDTARLKWRQSQTDMHQLGLIKSRRYC